MSEGRLKVIVRLQPLEDASFAAGQVIAHIDRQVERRPNDERLCEELEDLKGEALVLQARIDVIWTRYANGEAVP